MKIAILYLCTGAYACFFQQFYDSAMKNLLPAHDKQFFVLTDRLDAISDYPPPPNVETIYTPKQPRHDTMLHKNQLFLSLKEKIAHYDYVFSPNANIRINATINDDDMLPDNTIGQTMVCVLHLQFSAAFTNPHSLQALIYNTERNPESMACINTFPYQYCWSNAFTGGKPQDFFQMCQTITDWQQLDAAKGIIPIWHDESYFNKYRLLHADKFRILPIDYGMPELQGGFENVQRKIIILQKEKYMPADELI